MSNNDIYLKNILDNILSTLKNQSALSEDLIKLSDEKTNSIRENDIEKILRITQKEEKIASNMIQLEKERDALIKKLENIKGVKIVDLSSLVSQCSDENVVHLNLITEKLKDNFEILQSKNDINKSLLELILEQVEVYNNLIIGEKAPQTYEDTRFKNGKYPSANPNLGSFDTKY